MSGSAQLHCVYVKSFVGLPFKSPSRLLHLAHHGKFKLCMYIGAMNMHVQKSSLKLQSMQLISHYSVQTNTVRLKDWHGINCGIGFRNVRTSSWVRCLGLTDGLNQLLDAGSPQLCECVHKKCAYQLQRCVLEYEWDNVGIEHMYVCSPCKTLIVPYHSPAQLFRHLAYTLH